MTHQNSYYLKPGYIYISRKPTKVVTVLGSCVSFCFYDRKLKYGGVNHFLMPRHMDRGVPSGKFGDLAVKKLYSLFLDYGSERRDLVVSIVGGATLYNTIPNFNVGEKNMNLAREISAELKLNVVFEDLGGRRGRKVNFYTGSNRLIVENLKDNRSCRDYRQDHC